MVAIMKTDASAPSPTLVQRALSGHASIGLLAGALIYILCVSGMLAVIHERWQRWEEPQVAETPTIAPAAVQRGLEAVLASEKGKPKTTHLYVHMPTDGLPRTVVTTDHGAAYLDGDGTIAAPEAHAWTEFVTNLHIYLHLPQTLGLILVGILGVMLAALTVTGVVAHPRIFRDAFRLRARGGRQLAQADWHNRLGVWTLPFALALALTGAFVGLGSVGFTLLSKAYHSGDIERTYAPVFTGDTPEPSPDPRPAPAPNVAAALATMATRFPEVRPTYVVLHEPLTRSQHVQIIAAHPRRLIYGENYLFDAAGTFTGITGLSQGSVGRQVAASTYGLHFGSFGGLAVELAYIAIGLAMSVVTATGMSIWLQKRRRRGAASPRLEALWSVTVWGVPILFVAAYWLRTAGGHEMPLALAFWAGLGLAAAAALAWPSRTGPRALRRALGAMLLLTAIGHALLAASPLPDAVAINIALAATGLLILAIDAAFSFPSWKAIPSERLPGT
jgi:uncharacterized iron-regulated membrane protein